VAIFPIILLWSPMPLFHLPLDSNFPILSPVLMFQCHKTGICSFLQPKKGEGMGILQISQIEIWNELPLETKWISNIQANKKFFMV
jgi:hypothetical protein